MMVDLTGKTLGKYRLVERLGRGGMAEVYKAYQPGLDRYVAIKLMHGYLADDPDFVGRFQREAKAIAALHHPNIVQVHDFDIEGDVYYMVQEYIEGGTLKTYMQKFHQEGKKIPLDEIVRIMTAICDAVDYAHRQGRIHRDIKPDNIMFDLHNRPVLTDFGIATIVGGTRFTATGAMVGTPAYMSPEQGKGYPGDERSDVYSLGVVLYEMITGRVPFDADTPLAVVLKHLNEPLPMPRMLNPDVPYSIERVILKALAKDPADRYQTANELAEALREAVEEEKAFSAQPVFSFEPLPDLIEPVSAVPPTAEKAAPAVTHAPTPPPVAPPPVTATPPPVTQTPPPATAAPAKPKNRGWLWAVGLLAGVILVMCCVLAVPPTLRYVREWSGRHPTVTPAVTQAVETRPVDLTKQPVVAVPQAPSVDEQIEQGFNSFNDDCSGDLERALDLFEQVLDHDPEAVYALIGQAFVLHCQGYNNSALESINRAIELSPEDALVYYVRGRIMAAQQKTDEALADFTTATAYNPDLAEAYYRQALLYIWPLEQYDLALENLNRTIEIKPDFAPAYLERGNLLFGYKNDPETALNDFDRVVELWPEQPQGYVQRATVYEATQNYEQAVVEWTQAIERMPETEKYIGYLNRGRAHHFGGHLEDAVQDYTQAIEQNPSAEAYFNRGMAFYQLGRNNAALTDFDYVLLVGEDLYRAAAYHAKGWTLAHQGDYEQAVEAYTAALEYNFDDYAWPFFAETHPLLDRARAYRALEEFELALDDLDTLIDDLGYDGWALAYLERGLTYRDMGRRAEAVQDLRRAWELADKEELRQDIMRLLKEIE